MYPNKDNKDAPSKQPPKLGMSWGRPQPKRETPPPTPTKKEVNKGTMPLSEYQEQPSDKEFIQDTYLMLYPKKGR